MEVYFKRRSLVLLTLVYILKMKSQRLNEAIISDHGVERVHTYVVVINAVLESSLLDTLLKSR